MLKNWLAEHVVCLDEFKLGILAQNCISPGFTTLINILITTTPRAALNLLLLNPDISNGESWIKEYIQGSSMEIYPVSILSFFCLFL
jgi:hypothetical protein